MPEPKLDDLILYNFTATYYGSVYSGKDKPPTEEEIKFYLMDMSVSEFVEEIDIDDIKK